MPLAEGARKRGRASGISQAPGQRGRVQARKARPRVPAETGTTEELKHTPLHGAHLELGARMAPFGGYDMPIQYEGILAEHRWTRENAGLFDVSHMGPGAITLDV